MKTSYTVQYFINKFEAIPEDKWCEGVFHTDDGKHCAGGHCGLNCGTDCDLAQNKEAASLVNLISQLILTKVNGYTYYGYAFYYTVSSINDGLIKEYQQPTPKQRILAALYDIKANEAVQDARQIIKTPSATFIIPFLKDYTPPEIEDVEYENGEREAANFINWFEQQHELQLLEHEK